MRSLALAAWLLAPCVFAAEPAYVPAAPEQVPLYSATPLPCKATDDVPGIVCKDAQGVDLLERKSLTELAEMRNTIFARYGWDGYRKEWLRNYFHSQPWFKPNPKFSYKLLTAADKKNVHFIATKENSFRSDALHEREDEVYARHGKVWNDIPVWEKPGGKKVKACDPPSDDANLVDWGSGNPEGTPDARYSRDCLFKDKPWYAKNPKYSDDLLTSADRIELGLLSRALGGFALDGEKLDKASSSLDRQMQVGELRKLSLRDLRYLRNTIYARRGRAFKSVVLQEHFAQMDWYKIDPQYADSKLTATDNRNIKLIRSVEDEFGGPLQDEDWLIDPVTDGA